MTQAVVDEVYNDYLQIFESDGVTPVTGKVNGDFNKTAALDGVVSAQTVTVTEFGGDGNYIVSFTPNEAGFWMLKIEFPDGSNTQVFSETVNVGGLAEAMLNVSLDESAPLLEMDVWLERNGKLVTAPTSCQVVVRNDAGTTLFTEISSSPQADGRFHLTNATVLVADKTYSATVTVVDVRGTVITGQAFSTVS